MNDFEEADILLIEASDEDAELTQRALRKGGVQNGIVRVHTGHEALDCIFGPQVSDSRAAGPPHGPVLPRLILLDSAIPGLPGTTFVKRLKAEDHTKAIPVILLTTFTATIVVGEYRALGVHDYLIQPVEAAAFIEMATRLGVELQLTR